MKTDWLILVDDREKIPLLFPHHLPFPTNPLDPHSQTQTLRIHTKTCRLETGDYQLSCSSAAVVERKGSLDELAENLLTPSSFTRLSAAFTRLSQHPFPLLLLEGSPTTLSSLKAPSHVRRRSGRGTLTSLTPPSNIYARLLFLLQAYHIPLLMLPTSTHAMRLAAGDWVASYLISGALHGSAPNPSPPLPSLRESDLGAAGVME